MKKRSFKTFSRRRKGVALIIVLAMLTILLALAVTLSGTTRAERGVVRVHTEVTSTRQLVHAAISRAITDMELQPGAFKGGRSFRDGAWQGDGANRIVNTFPLRRVFYVNTNEFTPRVGDLMDLNRDGDPDMLSANDLDLLRSDEAALFFTDAPADLQVPLSNFDSMTGNAWVTLRMNRQRGDQSRFTYIAENVSDAIDLNYSVYEEINPNPSLTVMRKYGETPLEIDWARIWSVAGTDEVGIADFVKRFGRIDTVREINAHAPGTVGRRYIYGTFSYEPEADYRIRADLDPPEVRPIFKVNVSGKPPTEEPSSLWRGPTGNLAVDLKQAFINLRARPTDITDVEADTLAACLVDYVDEDLNPLNPMLGSIEPVPMINELSIAGEFKDITQVDTNAWEYIFVAKYAVETWRPFVEEDTTSSFTFRANATFTVNADGADSPGTSTEAISAPLTVTVADPFYVVTNTVEIMMTGSAPPTTGMARVTMALSGAEVTDVGGVCDKISDLSLVATRNFGDPASGTGLEVPAGGKEVIDPRFNYATTDWRITEKPSLSTGGTLSGINHWTRKIWAEDNDPNDDPDDEVLDPLYASSLMNVDDPLTFRAHYAQMHCRNAPLDVVGEIGYLPYRNWRTIRLLAKTDDVYHRVGEYFTATNTTRTAEEQLLYEQTRGKINVNSDGNILASAFLGLPIELYPGQPTPPLFDDAAKVGLFGQSLDLLRLNSGYGAYASEWDLGARKELRQYFALYDPGNLSDFEIEAFFRNTMGLLTARNNVFTIMVMVQSLSDRGDPTSTVRAVATVWRDGMPSEGFVREGRTDVYRGIHPWFIQNITYLTDYEN